MDFLKEAYVDETPVKATKRKRKQRLDSVRKKIKCALPAPPFPSLGTSPEEEGHYVTHVYLVARAVNLCCVNAAQLAIFQCLKQCWSGAGCRSEGSRESCTCRKKDAMLGVTADSMTPIGEENCDCTCLKSAISSAPAVSQDGKHWDIQSNFHLSLSRSFPLSRSQRKPFLEGIVNAIPIFPHTIRFLMGSCAYFPNDNMNKLFLVLRPEQKDFDEDKAKAAYEKLVGAVDRVVAKFGGKLFYSPALVGSTIIF